jgi:ribosome maturation factor RimP
LLKEATPVLNQRQRQRLTHTLLQLAETHWPQDRFYPLGIEFDEAFGQLVVRFIAEGKGFRVSLEECATLSRLIDEPLESIPELLALPYSLEVSSPGLFRALTTPREATFYAGQRVACWILDTHTPLLPDQVPLKDAEATAALPLQEATLLGMTLDEQGLPCWQVTSPTGEAVTLKVSDYPHLQLTLAPHVVWPSDEAPDDEEAKG